MSDGDEGKPLLELRSFDTYMKSGIEQFKWHLKNFFDDHSELSVDHVRQNLSDINAYENINDLQPLKEEHIVVLDEDELDVAEAEQVVLDGEFFWEHAAAGEATRLALGTKYLLKLSDIPVSKMIEMRKRRPRNLSRRQQPRFLRMMPVSPWPARCRRPTHATG